MSQRAWPVAANPPTTEQLDVLWDDPPGWKGKLAAVQNDAIGGRMLLTGFFFLILGGSVDSVAMRAQLAVPNNGLIGPQLYNELFTNHGSVTMFLVVLPMLEGFAILTLPLIMGAREMPFPRLGAYAYYSFLMGGLLYYSATLFHAVPDAGWFAYTPLSGPEFSADRALDFWVLGLGTAEVGAIAGAVEITVAVLKIRAPGMSLNRLPLYAWSMLLFAVMVLFAFTPLIVGSFFLELDRGFGFRFFDPNFGGSTLLWQHLFWIFGHPEVYIQYLPATGFISMILPVMCRRRIEGYNWMVGAMIAIAFLSFGLWAHHMFTVGLPAIVLAFFAAASTLIGIPAGIQFFSWLATIWSGKPQWNTPMLFAVGFLVTFVIGGITGVMVASVPFDAQVHDSYFIVAHLHYVLIGGVALPMFAAVYYWFPKFTGHMLDERLGRWNFWLLIIGLHVTFFPMHILGLLGMPRRIYTYDADSGWAIYNLISSLGVLAIIAGITVFVVNIVRSRKNGVVAGPNPWGADSLEWAVPSPPPQQGWTTQPIIHSRHPLWDQDDLHSGTPQQEALVHAVGAWPLKWRAVMVVGTANGQPQEVFRVSGPSYWPFIAALGTVAAFASELLHYRPGIVASLAFIAFSVVMWNRPEPAPMTEQEELDFEKTHGVPVRSTGSTIVPRYAMTVCIMFTVIFFATLLLGYFYLRLDNPVWPPEGTTRLASLPALGTAALVVLGTLIVGLGKRRLMENNRGAMERLVGIGTAVGLAGAVVLSLALADQPFGPGDHAYASIFFTMGGFLVAMVLIAVVMSVSVLLSARRGHLSAHRHSPVDNLYRFWASTATMVVVGLVVLQAAPTLTS